MKISRIVSNPLEILSFSLFFYIQKQPISPSPARLFFPYSAVRHTINTEIPHKSAAIEEKNNDTVFRQHFKLIVLTILQKRLNLTPKSGIL